VSTIEGQITRYIITSFAPDVPPEQLPADLDLLDTGVVDSLGLLRLIAWVGDEYSIPVAERDVSPAQFSSVGAIAEFIREG
jgi:acyl carrier protein